MQIIGPKDSTEPQAGLDTTARAGPLAHLIVRAIVDGGDPEQLLSYNAIQWSNASHHRFPVASDWLEPVPLTVNGHKDYFSQRYVGSRSFLEILVLIIHRLGQECQPFRWDAPTAGLFDPADILIVSNGR